MAFGYRTSRRSGGTDQETRYSPTREVYPSSAIAHLWAHGLPPGGVARSSANLRAEGRDIFSYTTIMARRLVTKAGETVYLLNPRHYSVTTSAHQAAIRRAIPHGDTIISLDPGNYASLWVDLENRKAARVREYFQGKINSAIRASAAPRIRQTTRDGHKASAAGWYADWEKLHRLFKLPGKVESVKITDVADMAEAAKRDAERRAKQEKARAAAVARDVATVEAHVLPRWRKGEDGPKYVAPDGALRQEYTMDSLGYPALRLTHDGQEVETSHGACVFADDARRVLDILPRLLKNLDQKDDTASVGTFQGMTATRDALIIGCHRIPWKEVTAFCAYAGWPLPSGIPPK